MPLQWKIENVIFDSLYEADVLVDSIRNGIYVRLYDSYNTPDYKIAYSLALRLADMKEFRVFIKKTIDNEYRYKV